VSQSASGNGCCRKGKNDFIRISRNYEIATWNQIVLNNYESLGPEVHAPAKGKLDKGKSGGKNASRTDLKDAGALVKEKFAHRGPIASSLGPMEMQPPRR
jgi:hypothetical protein